MRERMSKSCSIQELGLYQERWARKRLDKSSVEGQLGLV